MYTEKDLVAIAKRENNTKRAYLVVNRLQGKHIPVSGSTAFSVFDELAESLRSAYSNEKLLLVGFAETATAIGARLAVDLQCSYMQTTREQIDNVDYLFFTESHSHATEQKLIKTDLDKIIENIDRIVFAEDEVTTGNTIMKIIDIISELYGSRVRFGVASLLNGMDEEHLASYEKRSIDVHYLVKTNHGTYTEIADSFKGDGEYFGKDTEPAEYNITEIDGAVNARRLVNGKDYAAACEQLFSEINSKSSLNKSENLLVLGTEEFMYPALYVASRFEALGINTLCHSTTRSPIVTSREDNYPLQKRFELASLYDDERRTFIYNLKKYDNVIIVTDAVNESDAGINSLVNALHKEGNNSIEIYRWCSK